MNETAHSTNVGEGKSYEYNTLNVRAVIWTTIVLFASLLAGMGLMLLYFNILESRAEKNDAAVSSIVDRKAIPPEPRLQFSNIHKTTEVEDLNAMRKREDAELNGYAWADRDKGVVRMPIAAAMDAYVARGGAMPATPAQTAGVDSSATTAQPAATAPAAQPATGDTAAAGH